MCSIYLHQRGAFSIARFDRQGNAKAQIREASDSWLHVFYVYGNAFSENMLAVELAGERYFGDHGFDTKQPLSPFGCLCKRSNKRACSQSNEIESFFEGGEVGELSAGSP